MARLSAANERRLIAAARRKFPPGNRYGIFGFDIGPAIHCGRRAPGRTLRVYVERKDSLAPKVPALVVQSAGKRLRVVPDIIATGALPRASDAEDHAFTGLHVGCAIRVKHRSGAVGLILGMNGSPTHLVVAGHLFADDELDQEVRCGRRTGPSRVIGRVVCNLLDARPTGLAHAIDAALVELNELGVELAISTEADKAPVVASIASKPTVAARAAQAFRPTAHDYSERSPTQLLLQCTVISSARPNGYTVQDVLCTEHEITRAGDSGTILVLADEQDVGVGTCIGINGRGTLIEPLDRALSVFATVVPNLGVWSAASDSDEES